jgi:hypothetical protein
VSNTITPIENTNNIRYADFVRVTTPTATYRFSTAPSALTIPAIDSQPFDALGALMKVGDAQQDIKSTANETTFTLVGIDTAVLGWVLGQNIKGSQIEAWHGFFNTEGELITFQTADWTNNSGTAIPWTNNSSVVIPWIQPADNGGLYQFFNGYINSFTITEVWMEEVRSFVGVVTVSASSIQLILKNRVAGRYTNDSSWQFFNNGDTSMDRVAFISTINYLFGKGASADS